MITFLFANLLTAACGASGPSGAPGATAGVTAGASVPGPGDSYAITDPAAGLTTLAAYRATLTLSFAGMQAGSASAWSQSYTLTVAKVSGTRVLEYAETGLGAGPAAYPAMEAFIGEAAYSRQGPGDTCTAGAIQTSVSGSQLAEPASLLPKVRSMSTAGGTETIAGVEVRRSTFDAAAIMTGTTAQAQGSVAVATETGVLLAFDLKLTGGHDVFDADTDGTMTWAYALTPLDPAVVALPADCPPPLPAIPVPGDAANVLHFSSYLSYETKLNAEAVAAFYATAMPAAGFTQDGDTWVGAMGATMGWSKDGQAVQVIVTGGIPTTVQVTPKASAGEAGPTPVPQPTTAAVSAMLRVTRCLTLLLGSDREATALGSYHLVYNADGPYWANAAVKRETSAVTGDVAGHDVHFEVRTTGRYPSDVAGYRIGGVDYAVEKGSPVRDSGMAYIAWVSWPLDAIQAIGFGSLKAEAAGTATISGRTAEVYTIKGSIADDPTGSLGSLGLPITAADGTVWVDQATGALLKADVSYTSNMKDIDGTHGAATGSFTLEVSRVGVVTVALP